MPSPARERLEWAGSPAVQWADPAGHPKDTNAHGPLPAYRRSRARRQRGRSRRGRPRRVRARRLSGRRRRRVRHGRPWTLPRGRDPRHRHPVSRPPHRALPVLRDLRRMPVAAHLLRRPGRGEAHSARRLPGPHRTHRRDRGRPDPQRPLPVRLPQPPGDARRDRAGQATCPGPDGRGHRHHRPDRRVPATARPRQEDAEGARRRVALPRRPL